MCFKNGGSPVSFPQRTLDEEDTEEFFKTDKLNERYINRLKKFLFMLQVNLELHYQRMTLFF